MGMTTNEAIEILLTESVEIGGNAVSVARFLTALDVAVKALADVPDTDVGKNEPLTLDELRDAAETGDPVWIVGSKSNNTQLVNGWVVIERVLDDALHQYVDYAEFGSDEPFYFKISDYGDLLKAYRHRPKEET